MFWRPPALLALVIAAAVVPPAHATVWQRTRADGTVEFTNVAPGGGRWSAVAESRQPPRSRAPLPLSRTALLPRRPASTVWAREHDDGTMEFTNVAPIGARWKVLFRIGPGKAAAVRGISDAVPPRDGSSARFNRYDDHIRDAEAIYGIPRAFLRALIKTESDFDPHVVSSAGAQGLTQLMPSTGKSMGVTDVWDPRQNIMGGARYLQLMAKRFCKTPAAGGSGGGFVCSLEEKVMVLAGYHAGPGAVEKYRGMPPYETTRYYVTTVLQRYEEFRIREAALSEIATR